jgi:hypothetical protein
MQRVMIEASECRLLNKGEESEGSVSIPRLCLCVSSCTRSPPGSAVQAAGASKRQEASACSSRSQHHCHCLSPDEAAQELSGFRMGLL